MNFKYKCFLQTIFSNLPKGEILNYLFQKHLTHSLPGSNEHFLNKVKLAHEHFQKFTEYNSVSENTKKYFEFGAGWDLISPISMGLMGFEVTCIDIRKLTFDELIRDTIKKFNDNAEQIPFKFSQTEFKEEQSPLEYLKKNLSFNYLAPLDARNTKLASNSFEFITSTSTFEHIPYPDIALILKETYRILKKGGILSLVIDYQDHWSYFDKNISIYNFIKYSDKEWKKYNPSLQYQNRLRHRDYLDIIKKTDFEIVESTPIKPSQTDSTHLKNMKVDYKYSGYSFEELAVKGSHIVLKK